jgi:hypothetical protein
MAVPQIRQEYAAAPETLGNSMLIIRSVLDHAIDHNLIRSWFTRNIWDPTIKRAGCRESELTMPAIPAWPIYSKRAKNPVFVKEQAGHTSAAFTLDRHGHLIPSRNRTRRDVGNSVPGESRAAD